MKGVLLIMVGVMAALAAALFAGPLNAPAQARLVKEMQVKAGLALILDKQRLVAVEGQDPSQHVVAGVGPLQVDVSLPGEQVGERRPQADARKSRVTPVEEVARRIHRSVEALLLHYIDEYGERCTLQLRRFTQHTLQRW